MSADELLLCVFRVLPWRSTVQVCPCQRRRTGGRGHPALFSQRQRRKRHSFRWNGPPSPRCIGPSGRSQAEGWRPSPEIRAKDKRAPVTAPSLSSRVNPTAAHAPDGLQEAPIPGKPLALEFGGCFTNPPSLWRAFQYRYCGTRSRWRCRRSGKTSSSPTGPQLGGSLPGQEGTWWWWGARPSAARSPHTEVKPWNEAPCRHCPAFRTPFAEKGKRTRSVAATASASQWRVCTL